MTKTNKSSVRYHNSFLNQFKINSRMTFIMMTILEERTLNEGKVEIKGGKKVI